MVLAIMLAVAFSLLGAADLQAGECNAYAVEVATSPVPYQYPHGLEKAALLLAKVPARADTILIGDSLVEFWPKDVVIRQFKSESVWNIGVGGAETQTVLWQLERIDAPSVAPKRLLVLIGTNNLTHDYLPACAIAAGIKTVVTAAHAKWPAARVDIMGIPPRGADFRFRDADRLSVNAEIRNWSGQYPFMHYFEVDASEMTCGRYGDAVEVAAAGAEVATGSRCENYADDFGHFRRPGYDVVFAAMTKH
ncbi:hypothetical protein JJB09_02865 [Rhizobium sp. KVB221]|uniref:SGNH hydrolase-type esterase domain-containing protein n=1 Tax=Rhizobium setariae TaxID=2801340 RepID=A0A936YIQ8_9HYPH|nr:GDSL-type esterase/lipase family protein [Rhizobium setariae]MBL0370960.1 hypothetical protein [Rhizobium setariae]